MPTLLRITLTAGRLALGVALLAALLAPLSAWAAPSAQTPEPGSICFLAFDDPDGNGARDAGEGLVADVTFTVRDNAHVVATYTTDGQSEPHCLDLLPGNYHVTEIQAPDRAATAGQTWEIQLVSGTAFSVDYGSRVGGAPSGGVDLGALILSYIGVIPLLGALGLVVYLIVRRRR